MLHHHVPYMKDLPHFCICSCRFLIYNDSGLNFYSLSLTMKLNIPKYQLSFTLLALCVLLEVSQVFLIFNNKTRLRLYKTNHLIFKLAEIRNSKHR